METYQGTEKYLQNPLWSPGQSLLRWFLLDNPQRHSCVAWKNISRTHSIPISWPWASVLCLPVRRMDICITKKVASLYLLEIFMDPYFLHETRMISLSAGKPGICPLCEHTPICSYPSFSSQQVGEVAKAPRNSWKEALSPCLSPTHCNLLPCFLLTTAPSPLWVWGWTEGHQNQILALSRVGETSPRGVFWGKACIFDTLQPWPPNTFPDETIFSAYNLWVY